MSWRHTCEMSQGFDLNKGKTKKKLKQQSDKYPNQV